jgi:hypothetical protein
MNDQTTVVGSPESARNSLRMYGVDRVRTGEVKDNGRVYVGTDISGERVEYGLLREGVVASIGSKLDGSVTLNDIEEFDRGKVQSNGVLYVGSDYSGEEVTLAVSIIEPESDVEAEAEVEENHQTAES